MPRYIAHLIGHPAEITITCACTRVLAVSPVWVLERCGVEATIEQAEQRLVCKTCGERARLKAKGQWAVTGGRDQRVDVEPLPGWVDLS